MKIRWSRQASDDIGRLHRFLEQKSPAAAVGAVQSLLDAPLKLLDHPRLGERLHSHGDREIRHLRVGDYELRYEIDGELILIVRVWHSREDR